MYNYSYETLSNFLVSDWQIRDNLDRSMNKNLISKLSKNELTALALKYYAVDKNGKFTSVPNKMVGYVCPYTGEIVEINKIQLDHIIPLQYNGGTVIFNCIPVSEVANRSKWHSPDLIEWWKKQPYFDEEKLERLVNYMLDAYKIYANDSKNFFIDYSFNIEEDIESREEFLDIEGKDSNISKESISYGKSISYYQLMEKMIMNLPKSKQKVYMDQLNEFDIFNGIEEIEKITRILKKILSKKAGVYLSVFLNINLDKLYKSLTTDNYEKEIKARLDNIERILKENNKTLKTYFDSLKDIEECNLLYFSSINQKQIDKFIDSLKLDLDTKINIFIEMASNPDKNKVKKSHNILVPDDDNIFNTQKGFPFSGYEKLPDSTRLFYAFNRTKIRKVLDDQINELTKKKKLIASDKEKLKMLYDSKKAMDDYDFYNPVNVSKRIDIFIEMASKSEYTGIKIDDVSKKVVPDNNNIFCTEKGVKFEGYHDFSITTKQFYGTNKDKIVARINHQISELTAKRRKNKSDLEKLEMLKKALKSIDNYEFYNTGNVDRRIDKFIEMLGDPKNTRIVVRNGKVYPATNSIFNYDYSGNFKDYEDLNLLTTSYFYCHNKPEIKERIEKGIADITSKEILTSSEKRQLKMLRTALQAVNDYEFYNPNDNSKRMDVFIEMLSNPKNTRIALNKQNRVVLASDNILKDGSPVLFDGYERLKILKIGHFYHGDNIPKIKYRIDWQITELSRKINKSLEEVDKLNKLKLAKQAINDFEFYNPNDASVRIDKFIEMLSNPANTGTILKHGGVSPADDSILNPDNVECFKGYEHLNILTTSNFYTNNKDEIRERLTQQLNELYSKTILTTPEKKQLNILESAQKALDDYDFYNSNDNSKRIEKFIEMIGMDEYTGYINGKPAKGNIFKEPTVDKATGKIKEEDLIKFKDYGHIQGLYIGSFWRKNGNSRIIPLLFFDEMYSGPQYDKARNNVIEFLNYKRRLHKQPLFDNIYDYIKTLDFAKKENMILRELLEKFELENKELEKEVANLKKKKSIKGGAKVGK